MTIKKKDGNVYVLEGPNKLTKNQEKIDLSKCVFHNFDWQEIIHNSKNNNNSKIKIDKKQEDIENKLEKNKKSKDDLALERPPENFEEKSFEENEEIEESEEINFPILKVKVLMHCLPVVIKNYKDNLYGENWQKINYGKKFIFPSVVISNSDLHIEFWTSDPKNKIIEKSIIYPFSYEIYNQNTNSYDRVPYDEYRWWKVTSKEEKEGGYLIKAVPSEDHPDFSD